MTFLEGFIHFLFFKSTQNEYNNCAKEWKNLMIDPEYEKQARPDQPKGGNNCHQSNDILDILHKLRITSGIDDTLNIDN